MKMAAAMDRTAATSRLLICYQLKIRKPNRDHSLSRHRRLEPSSVVRGNCQRFLDLLAGARLGHTHRRHQIQISAVRSWGSNKHDSRCDLAIDLSLIFPNLRLLLRTPISFGRAILFPGHHHPSLATLSNLGCVALTPRPRMDLCCFCLIASTHTHTHTHTSTYVVGNHGLGCGSPGLT